jgi:hypothetical protein
MLSVKELATLDVRVVVQELAGQLPSLHVASWQDYYQGPFSLQRSSCSTYHGSISESDGTSVITPEASTVAKVQSNYLFPD